MSEKVSQHRYYCRSSSHHCYHYQQQRRTCQTCPRARRATAPTHAKRRMHAQCRVNTVARQPTIHCSYIAAHTHSHHISHQPTNVLVAVAQLQQRACRPPQAHAHVHVRVRRHWHGRHSSFCLVEFNIFQLHTASIVIVFFFFNKKNSYQTTNNTHSNIFKSMYFSATF